MPIRLNDIDIVVNEITDLGDDIAADFLIHHFHPTREAGNVVMQIVDARTSTRVDLFSARSAGLGDRAVKVDIDGIALKMTAAEDLTARLAAILAAVTDGKVVDGKYLESFRMLANIADREAVKKLWTEYRRQGDPADFDEMIANINNAIDHDPALLAPIQYAQDLSTRCPWCVEDGRFPRADPARIAAILGHV